MPMQSKRREFLKGVSLLTLASAGGCASENPGVKFTVPSNSAKPHDIGMRRRKERFKELNYDLVVVGGGMAGICAAMEAARNGTKTALATKGDGFV